MLHTEITENNDNNLLRIILFIQMRTNFKFLLLLKKDCCFINLQENLHNAVYIKFSYSWMAYLFWMCIINIGRYEQSSSIYDMQLVTWSMLVKADLIMLIRYSKFLYVISEYYHSHFITLIHVLIVILCFQFVKLLHISQIAHLSINSHNLSNLLYAAKYKTFGQLWRELYILFKRIFKFFLT